MAAGQRAAQNLGLGCLPFVEIEHPVYTRSSSELEGMAASALDELVRVLTSPAAELEALFGR